MKMKMKMHLSRAGTAHGIEIETKIKRKIHLKCSHPRQYSLYPRHFTTTPHPPTLLSPSPLKTQKQRQNLTKIE